MAPREVLLLFAALRAVEITIVAVLLPEILAVSTIFVVVPGVVIVAFFIVITFFMVVSVVRSRYRWNDKSSAYNECAQN